MNHFSNINPKSKRMKQFGSCLRYIGESCSTDNRSRWFVCDTKDQLAATLVRDCDAVSMKLLSIELHLSFFKLEMLILRGGFSPKINLFWSRPHGFPNSRYEFRSGRQPTFCVRRRAHQVY